MGFLNFWKKKDKPPQEEAQPPVSTPEAPELAPEPGQDLGQAPSGPDLQPQAPPPEVTEPQDETQAQLLARELAPPTAQEEASPDPAEEEAPPPPEKKKGFFARLAERLGKTREKISGSIDRLTLGRKIDDELLDELEEVLVTADLGVKTSLELIEGLRGQVRRQELKDAEALKAALRAGIEGVLTSVAPAPSRGNDPHVIMVVGVNGVGKTTTLAKLAHQDQLQGRAPLLIAGDTFRAAAVEQLQIWGERLGAPVIHQKTGADPAAVVFDGLAAALAREVDTVFIDTAGRLHTKVNLMEELKKIFRTAGKKLPGAPHEVLLVLDATTGQNALSQARIFHEAVGVSGIILTKMDGTAKGGVALAVAHETGLPLRYIGLGEGLEDLRPFDAEAFVAAILGGNEVE